MKIKTIKWFFIVPLTLFALAYIAGALILATSDRKLPAAKEDRASYQTVTIFGATGTAGDGILKALLADTDIETVHVITRRTSPRIEQGVESGRVQMTLHTDYKDYAAIQDQIADSDAVFWAIGTSSLGVDEATYAMIHVDFPVRFLEEWIEVSTKPNKMFHYISSSDISETSTSMWARQKVRAEKALFALAESHTLKAIAYRPDYIGPTQEQGHIGQDLIFWFFRPVGAAVRAQQIGQAMIEVSARESDFKNGDKLGTGKIILYSDAYDQHHQ